MIVARLLRIGSACAAITVLLGTAAASAAPPDPGKKACAVEARRLCPAEMRSFSRKRVETCMIAKIALTSAVCHSAMLKIKADREASGKR